MEDEPKLQFPSLPDYKEETLDWAYPMRREMQEILPGLFLGPYSAAMKSKLPVLEKLGITHIVCVRQDIEANFIKPNFPQKFRYLVFDIADNPVENIIRYFPREYEAIYLARLTIQMMSPLQLGRSFSVQAGTAGQSRYFVVAP
ncbi:UNVERIFIED_CONTAM: hypothetical protein FKN15_076405 [Acipenser sinensis]